MPFSGNIFKQHHAETQEHVERVEAAFRELEMEPSSALSPGLAGLVEQHDTIASKIVEPALRDRWHALAGIAVEHFEIALYTGLPGLDANRRDEQEALKKIERWLS